MDEDYTDQIIDQAATADLSTALGYGAVVPEPKLTVHTFLQNVVNAEDTTKVGNVSIEELGNPKHPIRTYKSLALIAGSLMSNSPLNRYFLDKSEIITSTSLSKEAKLIDLAVVTRKEFGATKNKKQMKENKGWFRRKNKEVEESG